MSDYKPGLHILSTFSSTDINLTDMEACKDFFDSVISELQLHNVGEVYHEFDNKGFTVVICLTESHISLHTWPEHSLATFDVFLSNFNEDNSRKAKELYKATIAFFNAIELNKQEVFR